jgi:hypothetical protein
MNIQAPSTSTPPPPANSNENSQNSVLARMLSVEYELWRRQRRTSLEAFCIEALRFVDQKSARHHLLLIDELGPVDKP